MPLLIVALIALAAGWAGAQQPPLGLVPEQGLLLLKNGQSIEGKITRAGELYYVVLPNGEIRIKAADVEFVCRNVEEGYDRKRTTIHQDSVGDHLGLAQWCLRHGLTDQAAQELAESEAVQPGHPMIGVLRRRLIAATQRPTKPAPPAKPTESPLPKSASPESELPESTSATSAEDLLRLVRGMPAGTVETFTGQIQPVLVNNCAAAKCHGPATKSDFRLQRIPAGKPPSRLTTQRNLQATLDWIDRERPAASPLLTAPIRAHGPAKTAAFTKAHLAQYHRLAEWVYRVAKQSAIDTPVAEVPVAKVPIDDPFASFPRRRESSDLDPRLRGEDDQPSLQPNIDDPFAKTFPVQPNAPGVEFVPIDPFDPEIFNRRYSR